MPSPRYSQDPSLNHRKKGGRGWCLPRVLEGGVALTRQEKGGVGLILQKRWDMADDLR